MSEITAQHKFNCPSCGAEAQWNPAKKALVCPFCGCVSPAELSVTGDIIENDLVAALRAVDDSKRGLDTERKSVKCQSCQAITLFDPNHAAKRCDFCGSAAIIPIEEQTRPIRPESLLEFKIAEPVVRESIRIWYKSRWFAPNKLGTHALTDTVHGIYIPYWTFDAQTSADWTAMSGDHYYETERYTDSQGKSQTRQVQRTRWYPTSGHVDHFFDDELVAATKGVDPALLREVEPFPTTTDLKPYAAGFLSGWTVEQYQIDLIAAAQTARELMDNKTRALCAKEVPGDTHRDLQVHTDYSAQTFKHVLVPVWLLAYTYGRESYQVVVNGYTGTIAGRYPKSWIKITLLILVILGVIIAIATLINRNNHANQSSTPDPNLHELERYIPR